MRKRKAGRNPGLAVVMAMFYAQVGYTRLLGLLHIFFWVPLGLYLLMRLRNAEQARIARFAMVVFLVTITISLVFDTIDVARYLAGERGSLIPAARTSGEKIES